MSGDMVDAHGATERSFTMNDRRSFDRSTASASRRPEPYSNGSIFRRAPRGTRPALPSGLTVEGREAETGCELCNNNRADRAIKSGRTSCWPELLFKAVQGRNRSLDGRLAVSADRLMNGTATKATAAISLITV